MAFMGAMLSALKGLGGAAKEGIGSALKSPDTWVGKPGQPAQPGGDSGAQPMQQAPPLDLTGFAPHPAQNNTLDPHLPINVPGAPVPAPFFPSTPAPLPTLAPQTQKPGRRLGVMDGITAQ